MGIGKWTANDIPDQTGRVAIITGANSGLGYETALALARKGAQVVMACRSLDRGEKARKKIVEQIPSASARLMQLDLGSLDSVAAFADSFREKYDRLDLLINNAGVMAPPYRKTKDGFEMQLGVNHLGHFALTGHLLNMLLETPDSRVVNVTSSAQYFGEIDFDDLQSEESYVRYDAYAQSKLANVLFTLELQRRLDAIGADTLSVTAHPGLSATDLQSNTAAYNNSWLEGALYGLMHATMSQSQEMGALPQLYAATASDVKGGEHFAPKFFEFRGYPKRTSVAKAGRDPETARRLWEVSEELTGQKYQSLRKVAAAM